VLAPDDPRHGTPNGYANLGCRCEFCRKAQTAYLRERGIGTYRRNACACGNPKTLGAEKCQACRFAEIAADHGTESKYFAGCRCDECRRASAAGRRRRRHENLEASRAYDRAYKARTRGVERAAKRAARKVAA
jgi:hypothetical protein